MKLLIDREMTQKRLDKTFDESAAGILKFYTPPPSRFRNIRGVAADFLFGESDQEWIHLRGIIRKLPIGTFATNWGVPGWWGLASLDF